jgi:hypothetical protein
VGLGALDDERPELLVLLVDRRGGAGDPEPRLAAAPRELLLARTLVCTGVRTLRSSWARARSRASALST